MLSLSIIRSEHNSIVEGLKKRNWDDEQIAVLDRIIELDDQRKEIQTRSDKLLAERNRKSKEIGDLFKSGKANEANALKEAVAELKEQIEALQSDADTVKSELDELLVTIPNTPHDLVPAGNTEDDNEVYRAWDKPLPQLFDGAMPHWELAEKYRLIDFKTAVDLSGSGFALFRGRGARLERALISFFLDRAVEAGYEEILPPLLVNAETAFGTGQLPDKEGQMYFAEKDGLYLIPTAEVPVTNILRGKILRTDELPVKMAGYTPCFRREAGSYGADVKGLNRVHQFDKVEIVQVQRPERSYETLGEMVDHVSHLLDLLDLPYRILRLCGGDLGFAAAMTYDFEVYSAAQKKWLEVSSVSNFETYQSNRMQLRYRDENGKNQLLHTLNGSALALARVVAALLENNQTKNGIEIPEVLKPYTGFSIIE